MDLVSAAVSFFTVREAGKPADEDHPFGHGKIETLSSLFESLLLILAAILITYEGVNHLLSPQPIHYQGLAMATIVVSLAVSYAVYIHNRRAAMETESSALHVNALHFLSDVVASAGILIGLVLLRLTGWLVIDPIMAFLVAAYILLISARQVKQAILELSDTQLPESEIRVIRDILRAIEGQVSEKSKVIEAHDLRTRKGGSIRHIDFHLVVCRYMTVQDSHAVCDQLESKILENYPAASVNIHVEPCENEVTHCISDCAIYRAAQPS